MCSSSSAPSKAPHGSEIDSGQADEHPIKSFERTGISGDVTTGFDGVFDGQRLTVNRSVVPS
jgi:hypothetical protein